MVVVGFEDSLVLARNYCLKSSGEDKQMMLLSFAMESVSHSMGLIAGRREMLTGKNRVAYYFFTLKTEAIELDGSVGQWLQWLKNFCPQNLTYWLSFT